MSRHRCAACRHVRHIEIDAALLAGEPLRHVARHYGLHREAVRRHAADHVPGLAGADDAVDVAAPLGVPAPERT